MKIQQIVETTTAGSVAPVAQPMMTQTRENTNVRGLKPVQQVMKGAKKKGPYANSIVEGKVKELSIDLKELTDLDFKKKYGKTKAEIRASMKKEVNEEEIAEQDLIVIPGQGRLRRTGFVKHDLDQGEHEGHTLKNSLHTIARAASELDKRLSVQSEFPEWVSEKIGAAKSMMVTVMDYLISSQEMQHDRDAMNEGSQRVDSLVTDALKVMKGPEVSDAVLALKRVLGDRAYNERRGFYSFYVEQIVDMYRQQGVAEGSLNELKKSTIKSYADKKQAELDDVPPMPFKKPAMSKAEHEKAAKGMTGALARLSGQKPTSQGVAEGIDAAWDAAKEKVSEGAKVDRMVKHVKQSEKKLGHSDKEAENIAWATANKRGMLDNKNKKK